MTFYIGLPLELEELVEKTNPNLYVEESTGAVEELSVGGGKKELVQLLLVLLQLEKIDLDQFIQSFEEMESYD